MPARKHPVWTEEELKVLKRMYNSRNAAKRVQEILPNRKTWDIVKKANELGLVTRSPALHDWNLEELFSRCEHDFKTDCWNWKKGLRSKRTGYGVVVHKGNRTNAHRLAYSLANPFIDISKSLICHHCDNRLCINPKHLYAGTYTDNNRDTVNRGRYRNQYGARHENI